MKLKPKSCSCWTCRRGKGTKVGKYYLKLAERRFRRKSKELIKIDKELFILVPYADYPS